jgi:hypothetical protein
MSVSFVGFVGYYSYKAEENERGCRCNAMGEMRNGYKIVVGKLGLRWPLGR